MASCVKPLVSGKTSPLVLLHGFDRYSDYTMYGLHEIRTINSSLEPIPSYHSALV